MGTYLYGILLGEGQGAGGKLGQKIINQIRSFVFFALSSESINKFFKRPAGFGVGFSKFNAHFVLAPCVCACVYRTSFDIDQILPQSQSQGDNVAFIDRKMGFQQDAGFGYIERPTHPLLDNLVIFIQTHI